MKLHSTVVAILHSPREKVWGQLLDLNPAGVTIHGLDLNGFDEWLQQWGSEEEGGLATVFYPLHRVERMELDEPIGDIPSLEQRFQQRTHLTLTDYLKTATQGNQPLSGKRASQGRALGRNAANHSCRPFPMTAKL